MINILTKIKNYFIKSHTINYVFSKNQEYNNIYNKLQNNEYIIINYGSKNKHIYSETIELLMSCGFYVYMLEDICYRCEHINNLQLAISRISKQYVEGRKAIYVKNIKSYNEFIENLMHKTIHNEQIIHILFD